MTSSLYLTGFINCILLSCVSSQINNEEFFMLNHLNRKNPIIFERRHVHCMIDSDKCFHMDNLVSVIYEDNRLKTIPSEKIISGITYTINPELDCDVNEYGYYIRDSCQLLIRPTMKYSITSFIILTYLAYMLISIIVGFVSILIYHTCNRSTEDMVYYHIPNDTKQSGHFTLIDMVSCVFMCLNFGLCDGENICDDYD